MGDHDRCQQRVLRQAAMSARAYGADRAAQGFRSQQHLDAFYAAYDHVRACGECGQPGPAAWLEHDASWQPTETRCAEGTRLDHASDPRNFTRDPDAWVYA